LSICRSIISRLLPVTRESVWASVMLVLLSAAGCGDPLPRVEGDFAFVGVDVLPMTEPGNPVVLENQTVVVTNRRVASINPADEVSVGESVVIVNAEGQYLMPGLADMHGHLPSSRLMPVDRKNLLFLYVANGVTTLRVMQGSQSHFRLRDQIARGETLGPRLFLGSPAMTGASVRTSEQGEQLVREYHQNGYEQVKIHEGLTPEVFDAVASTAREVGIPFGGHVPDQVGLFDALVGGQMSIDHLDNYVEALVPDEDRVGTLGFRRIGDSLDVINEERLPSLVEATRMAGAWIVPTMAFWETVVWGVNSSSELRAMHQELRYIPPEIVGEWTRVVDELQAAADPDTNRRVTELRRTVLKALYEGGVPILLGTDSPETFDVPGFSIHHEMALLVELGMTPYHVLEAGTRRVAEYFDSVDDFGSVAVGQRADFLLLTADPIADVANVGERAGVMVNGRWISESQIQARLAGIARFYGN